MVELKKLKERIKEMEKNDDKIISDSAAEELIRDQLKNLKEKTSEKLT